MKYSGGSSNSISISNSASNTAYTIEPMFAHQHFYTLFFLSFLPVVRTRMSFRSVLFFHHLNFQRVLPALLHSIQANTHARHTSIHNILCTIMVAPWCVRCVNIKSYVLSNSLNPILRKHITATTATTTRHLYRKCHRREHIKNQYTHSLSLARFFSFSHVRQIFSIHWTNETRSKSKYAEVYANQASKQATCIHVYVYMKMYYYYRLIQLIEVSKHLDRPLILLICAALNCNSFVSAMWLLCCWWWWWR